VDRRRLKARVTPWGALVCLVAVLLTGAAQSFAAASQADAVLYVQGRITLIAADGNHVAVTTTVKRACARRIVVWSAPGRSSVSMKPGILGCAGDGVTQLAVGGGRVAWIEQGGGNSLEMAVMAAGITGGARKQFEFATNGDRASGDPSGQWVGQLLGGGSLLAYNRWTQVCDRPEVESCGHKDPQLRLTGQELIRIASGRRAVLLRGPAAYPLVAVGGGHMAVETADGITIRDASGAEVAAVPNADSKRAALSTTRLAVETASTLDLYDPATGARGKSLSLGPAAALPFAGVTSKLALLRGPHRLVLVRLGDGKRISFPLRGAAATLVGGRLTDAGLFYGYNVRGSGRIVFEPTRKLLARF
jgi:hypothetical protein